MFLLLQHVPRFDQKLPLRTVAVVRLLFRGLRDMRVNQLGARRNSTNACLRWPLYLEPNRVHYSYRLPRTLHSSSNTTKWSKVPVPLGQVNNHRLRPPRNQCARSFHSVACSGVAPPGAELENFQTCRPPLTQIELERQPKNGCRRQKMPPARALKDPLKSAARGGT